MTGLIVIDEAGDLGSGGTDYFAMAALVIFRTRHLKSVHKLLPKSYERKWYNSSSEERNEIMDAMAKCRFKATVCAIEKNNPSSEQHVYGNELYAMALRQILKDAISVRPCNDLNIYVDSNRFITEAELRKMIREEASSAGANVLDCGKKVSSQMPCLQLVDYVAGGTRALYEEEDKTLLKLNEKISIARRYKGPPNGDRRYGSYLD